MEIGAELKTLKKQFMREYRIREGSEVDKYLALYNRKLELNLRDRYATR